MEVTLDYQIYDVFDQSLQTGKLPDDWVEANVAPVLKKMGSALSSKLQADIPHMTVFVPNYSNTSFVNKLCLIFRKTKLYHLYNIWLLIKTLMRKPDFDYS